MRMFATLALLLLVAGLLMPTAAMAQPTVGREARLTLDWGESNDGRDYFTVTGFFDFPDDTLIFLALRLEREATEHIERVRVTVRDQQGTATFGPFDRELLRADYLVEAWFNVDQQPNTLRRLFLQSRSAGGWGLQADHREIVTTEVIEIGSSRDKTEADRMILSMALDLYDEILEEARVIVGTINEAEARRNVTAEQFASFYESHYYALQAIEDRLDIWMARFIGVYHLDWFGQLRLQTHLLREAMEGFWYKLQQDEGVEVFDIELDLALTYSDKLVQLDNELVDLRTRLDQYARNLR